MAIRITLNLVYCRRMFIHSWHPQAILAHLGPVTIHWYGLTLALGTLAGFFVLRWLGKKYRLGEPLIFDYFLILVISGLLGARLYHITNEWSYYSQNPAQMFQVWHGGLAWHGGIIAGLIAALMFARKKKMSVWLLADITAPALALGQAIGRWGNYFNQELFGRPTSLPWGIPIDQAYRPLAYGQDQYFHPTFLYESLGCLVIFAILVFLHLRRWRQTAGSEPTLSGNGYIALIYIALAAGLRMATESLRIDRTPIVAGIRLPILVGGIFFLAALITLILLIVQRRQRHVT